jgi:nicotinate phosphoribosyltransferase
VRWELDSRGYNHVKIFVSGGLNDEMVAQLSLAGVDGFGVGTSVSNAPSIDFALDIVEADGKPAAKRGKLGGKKMVWRCDDCLREKVTGATVTAPKCQNCGQRMGKLLGPLISKGRLSKVLPSPDNIRERVLSQLDRLSASS